MKMKLLLNNTEQIIMLKKIIFLQISFHRKKRQRFFVPGTCPRYDKLLVSSRKKLYNFIRDYNDGETLPFENRPIVPRFADVVVFTIN